MGLAWVPGNILDGHKGAEEVGKESVQKGEEWDFPGSPVRLTEGVDLVPDQGAKMPHVLQPKDQNVNNRNRTFLVVQCLRILPM